MSDDSAAPKEVQQEEIKFGGMLPGDAMDEEATEDSAEGSQVGWGGALSSLRRRADLSSYSPKHPPLPLLFPLPRPSQQNFLPKPKSSPSHPPPPMGFAVVPSWQSTTNQSPTTLLYALR